MLFYILFFTFLGSIASLIGGIVLLYKENLALRVSHYLAAFAAGTLLGAAFLDLLPEAFGGGDDIEDVLFWTLAGILIFFLLERLVHWFHHHQRVHPNAEVGPTIPLVIVGDTVHNFIDGVAIAATFLVSIPVGVLTSLAVAAHEIPQEIGDFGILLHKGMKRKKIIVVNVLSALSAMFGAILTFYFGSNLTFLLPRLMAITAGFFIYIAASDLIPEIHHERKKGFAVIESFLLILGVVLVWIFVSALE
ncbi:MAG: ZIP family metal transporter [Candidatus Levybacteria bacterium]|nr:ZIP family metal transporter [Candidatus Levybacteria bacterium]